MLSVNTDALVEGAVSAELPVGLRRGIEYRPLGQRQCYLRDFMESCVYFGYGEVRLIN